MRPFSELPLRHFLIAAAAIFIGLLVWIFKLGGFDFLLDAAFTSQQADEILEKMLPSQRTSHLWMTLTLDSLFPLAYAIVLAILASRAGAPAVAFALPLLASGCDYAENGMQMMALHYNAQMSSLKSFVTPCKFMLIVLSLGSTAICYVHRRESSNAKQI